MTKKEKLEYILKVSFVSIPAVMLFILLIFYSTKVEYDIKSLETIDLRKKSDWDLTNLADSTMKVAQDLCIDGKRALSAREYKRAEYKFEESLEYYPDYTEAHRGLQDILFEQEKYLTSQNLYRDYWAKFPNSAVYNYLYGRTLDNSEESLRFFLKAIEIDSTYFWGYYGTFWELLNKGRLKKTREYLIKAGQCKNVPPQIYFACASLFKEEGQSEKAVVMFKKYL